MSKLIKKLRQITDNSVTPMGFKAASAAPVQRMLFIALITPAKARPAIQPPDFPVDAMMIQSQNLKNELKNIKRIAGNQPADFPLGIWFEPMTELDNQELKEAGVDFLLFIASQAPAALLQDEIGKVLKIDLKDDDGLIMSIDQLAIDALLIDFRESQGKLSVLQLMNCQRIACLTSKPLLIATQQELAKDEIKTLWEAGVNGIIVEATEENRQDMEKICRLIKDLPPVTRKTKGRRASLPNSGQITIPDDDEDM